MQSAAREMGAGDLARRVLVHTGDELEDMADAMNRMASQLHDTIAQLDAGKARLETLLANLADGVIVVAADRTVRTVNREAGRISTRPKPWGRPAVRRSVPESRGAGLHRRMGERRLAAAPGHPRRDAPGEPGRPVLGHAGPVPEDTGVALLFTVRDVTEERRLSQVKSDFVSNASHELRTPLTSIRGYLEAIQDAVREGAPPDPSFLAVATRTSCGWNGSSTTCWNSPGPSPRAFRWSGRRRLSPPSSAAWPNYTAHPPGVPESRWKWSPGMAPCAPTSGN